MQNQNELIKRVGHLTRLLHDSLAELGLDKSLVKFSSEIPVARERLSYVLKLTQSSADIVLTATERASPLQDHQLLQAVTLEERLISILGTHDLPDLVRVTIDDTLTFIRLVQQTSRETKQLILNIMMAQDFQDLTGQMIQTMATLTQTLEQQLAQILLDFSSSPNGSMPKETVSTGLLNGPQLIKQGDAELITTQAQVDALLENLGF
jgi:chemotaxis protein CheZ